MATSGTINSTGTENTEGGSHTYRFTWSTNQNSGLVSWTFQRIGTDTQWFNNNRDGWKLTVNGKDVKFFSSDPNDSHYRLRIEKSNETTTGTFYAGSVSNPSVKFAFNTAQRVGNKVEVYTWKIDKTFDPRIPGKPNPPSTAPAVPTATPRPCLIGETVTATTKTSNAVIQRLLRNANGVWGSSYTNNTSTCTPDKNVSAIAFRSAIRTVNNNYEDPYSDYKVSDHVHVDVQLLPPETVLVSPDTTTRGFTVGTVVTLNAVYSSENEGKNPSDSVKVYYNTLSPLSPLPGNTFTFSDDLLDNVGYTFTAKITRNYFIESGTSQTITGAYKVYKEPRDFGSDYSVLFTSDNVSIIEDTPIIPNKSVCQVKWDPFLATLNKGRFNYYKVLLLYNNEIVKTVAEGETNVDKQNVQGVSSDIILNTEFVGIGFKFRLIPCYKNSSGTIIESAETFESPIFIIGGLSSVVNMYPAISGSIATLSNRVPVCFKVLSPEYLPDIKIKDVVVKFSMYNSSLSLITDDNRNPITLSVYLSNGLSQNLQDHFTGFSGDIVFNLSQYTNSAYQTITDYSELESGTYITCAFSANNTLFDYCRKKSGGLFFITYEVFCINEYDLESSPISYNINLLSIPLNRYFKEQVLSIELHNNIRSAIRSLCDYYTSALDSQHLEIVNKVNFSNTVMPVESGDFIIDTQETGLSNYFFKIIKDLYNYRNDLNTGGFPTLISEIPSIVLSLVLQQGNLIETNINQEETTLSSLDSQLEFPTEENQLTYGKYYDTILKLFINYL